MKILNVVNVEIVQLKDIDINVKFVKILIYVKNVKLTMNMNMI